MAAPTSFSQLAALDPTKVEVRIASSNWDQTPEAPATLGLQLTQLDPAPRNFLGHCDLSFKITVEHAAQTALPGSGIITAIVEAKTSDGWSYTLTIGGRPVVIKSEVRVVFESR